jgi:hypothetical protein
VGDEEVLQLAAPGGYVVGLEPEADHEIVQRAEGRCQTGFVEAAVAQVDAAAPVVEDPEGRVSGGAAHDELGLVAVVRRGAASRVDPEQRGGDGREHLGDSALLVGQLLVIGNAHERAGPAASGVEVVTLHGVRKPRWWRCRAPSWQSAPAGSMPESSELLPLPPVMGVTDG